MLRTIVFAGYISSYNAGVDLGLLPNDWTYGLIAAMLISIPFHLLADATIARNRHLDGTAKLRNQVYRRRCAH